MTRRPAPAAEALSENEVVGAVDAVRAVFERGASHDFWAPTHVVHDSELDDLLAWALARRARPDVAVLAQLPADRAFDAAADALAARGCEVFRDPESRNGEALRLALGTTGVL